MFLLGFAGALRRSELVGLDLAHVTWMDDGLKLLIERSKTDKRGDGADRHPPWALRGHLSGRAALQAWLTGAQIDAGPLFPQDQPRQCRRAYRNGVPDEGIMGHTRHRSLTTMRSRVRWAKLAR